MLRFTRLADWLSWQETLHPSTIDLGLERLGRVLDRLNWPGLQCPVITVGGTNGKGSCVALLARILSEAGYRVGTFTSPHLLRYNERITLAGRQVSDASLLAAFERIDAARGADTLTFFEFNTLATLLIFETAALDVALLEVGLGGRLDAVNVLDADVALVTSIDLDHCDWLGNDRESIGREKAGIFRAGRPAVFAAPSMPQSIAEVAESIGAQLLRAGQDFTVERSGERWSWHRSGKRIDDLPPSALQGAVQYDNAAAVLTVLDCLADRLPVNQAAIVKGLGTVQLAGRFQLVHWQVDWIFDVAHNCAAAEVLARALREYGDPSSADGRQTIAVCGILGDKDIEGIAAQLQHSFAQWVVVKPASARAINEQVLAERLRKCGAHVTTVAPTVEEGCEAALVLAGRNDRIVVFGSFLTVGPALQWLEQRADKGPYSRRS